MNNKSSRGLKIFAIVFMGLTAAMNVLGGSGTICAAFLTKQFPPMWVFIDYQWLYQTLMITTILTGIAGIWAIFKLGKRKENAYRNAVIILAVGIASTASRYLR